MFRTLKYGDKSFRITPYNSAQEREAIVGITINEDEINEDSLFEFLCHFKNCIDLNETEFNNLTKNEIMYILWMLRGISVGEDVNVDSKCPSCGTVSNYDVNVSSDILLVKNSGHSNTIKIKNLIFIFKDNYSGIITDDTLASFLSINSSEEDISNVIDNLDLEDYEFLFSEVEKRIQKFNFTNTIKCDSCKEDVIFRLSKPSFILTSLSEDSLISFYKTLSFLVFYGKYTKADIDSMFPFERNILTGMLETNLKEYNQTRT